MPRLKSSEINNPNNFLLDLVKDNAGKRVPITNPNNALWCWDKYFTDKKNYKQKRDEILLAINSGKYYNTKDKLPEVGEFMLNPVRVVERIADLIKEHGEKIDLNMMTHQAIRLRDEDLFKFLLDNGANPNYIDKSDRTLMQVAIMRGVTSVFNLLWNHPNVDVNLKNSEGFNTAHFAVSYNLYAIFDTIVKKAPHLFVEENSTGKTPLDVLDSYNAYSGLFKNNAEMNYFKKVPTKIAASIQNIAIDMFKNNRLLVTKYRNPDLKEQLIFIYNEMLGKIPDNENIDLSKKMKI